MAEPCQLAVSSTPPPQQPTQSDRVYLCPPRSWHQHRRPPPAAAAAATDETHRPQLSQTPPAEADTIRPAGPPIHLRVTDSHTMRQRCPAVSRQTERAGSYPPRRTMSHSTPRSGRRRAPAKFGELDSERRRRPSGRRRSAEALSQRGRASGEPVPAAAVAVGRPPEHRPPVRAAPAPARAAAHRTQPVAETSSARKLPSDRYQSSLLDLLCRTENLNQLNDRRSSSFSLLHSLQERPNSVAQKSNDRSTLTKQTIYCKDVLRTLTSSRCESR